MPELPEVETIKRGLSRKVVNKKIVDIWIEPSFRKKISPPPAKFLQFLKGNAFKSVERRGKLLIFKVKDGLFMLCHLKMTGQLVYLAKSGQTVASVPDENAAGRNNRFNRVKFNFSDGAKLYFNDLRKFGYFKIVDKEKLNKETDKYGIEPFDPKFTFEYFNNILKKKTNQKIKIVLTDQSLIAGIGNIYADESCFAAKIKPMRIVKSLSLKERKDLFAEIKKVLEKAIKFEGTSVNTYVNSKGAVGQFRKFLKVYHRVHEKCLRCKKGIIAKVKIGGRGTSYCPNCQK
ncbi:MAG: bifunctional DNA-formamidopyrimidine glycosylase/DNA-(apurinic or apyrimidinic site) lyase [Parcubacteria group bacterium]